MFVLLAAAAPVGSARASHGGWDVGQTTTLFEGCDDLIRAALYGFNTSIGSAGANKGNGNIGAYAAAGINAPHTQPVVGVLVKPLPSPANCAGLGASEAEGPAVLHAVISWPGIASANRVRVSVTGVTINQSVTQVTPPTATIPGLADAGWSVLAGIRVSYFPCQPGDGFLPNCSPALLVLQDVEDIARSDSPPGVPAAVDLCVSDFLDVIAANSGSLVVDLTFSAFATAHGDGQARVDASGVASAPAEELVAGGCPSFPFESLTDGDTES